MESQVNKAAGGLTYVAENLEDIAIQLDRMSKTTAETSSHQSTIRDRRYQEGESAAYRHVADMLRRTTIKHRQPLPDFGSWSLTRLVAEAKRLNVPKLKDITSQQPEEMARLELVGILNESWS